MNVEFGEVTEEATRWGLERRLSATVNGVEYGACMLVDPEQEESAEVRAHISRGLHLRVMREILADHIR